mgnify:CR=1 FL=1
MAAVQNLYWRLKSLYLWLINIFREQWWRSGESNHLPPMWPGFDFQTRRHMCVQFVGSLLCSERFFPGYSSFPLTSKTCIWLNLIFIHFNWQCPQLVCLNAKQTWHLNKVIIIIIIIDIIILVDGNWSLWTDWGDCSQTCGIGVQGRRRSCTNPSPLNGGRDCDGEAFEVRSCNVTGCPGAFKFVYLLASFCAFFV